MNLPLTVKFFLDGINWIHKIFFLFSPVIIVNNTIILELKSVRRIIRAHEVQVVNYLVATGKPVGLILNFGERKVEIKRKIKKL